MNERKITEQLEQYALQTQRTDEKANIDTMPLRGAAIRTRLLVHNLENLAVDEAQRRIAADLLHENDLLYQEIARVEDHHVRVAEPWRPWWVDWPAYSPVDITPPELLPEALALEVPDWAEPAAIPDEVPNWPARQIAALIPFKVTDQGWPLNPTGRTGWSGRNLGKWGENTAADPVVIAGAGANRRVLLIRRDDIGQWAIPGGMVEDGETAPAALVRELREETTVDLAEVEPVILTRTVVDDWRNSDHAWVASTAALYLLPEKVTATAGDDAADAAWWPLPDLDTLTTALQNSGDQLYEAHRPLLMAALDHFHH